jgi:hypothetical protein
MNIFRKSIIYSAVGLILIGLLVVVIGGGILNLGFGETIDFADEYTDVRAINIEYGAGELTIRSGDRFHIEAKDVYKDYFKSEVKDGIWSISDTAGRSGWFPGNFRMNFGFWQTNHPSVTVYIPEGFTLDETTITLGAGKIDAGELRSDTFTLKVGAGEVKIDHLIAKNMKLECGVGSIRISGDISEDSKIECGVGSIQLLLSGLFTDYNYKVKVGLGSAAIGSNTYSGASNTTINNPGATATFDIETGLGEVAIRFAEPQP